MSGCRAWRALLIVAALARPALGQAVTLTQVVVAVERAPGAPEPALSVASAVAGVDAAGAWPAPGVRVETNRLTARFVVGATLPLPLAVGPARDEARAHAATVRAEAVLQQRALRLRAVTAWLALARTGATREAQQLAVQQAHALADLARGRLDAGAGSQVDVAAAHAAEVRAELAASTATQDERAAAAELAGVLGWDARAPWQASGPLPAPAGDSSAHPADSPQSSAATREGRSPRVDESAARMAAHPAHLAAVRRVAEQEATAARIASDRRPSVAIEAQASFSDPTQPGVDVLLGLAVDLPLFSHVGDRLAAARAETRIARTRLAATEAELTAAMLSARERWQAARDQLNGLERDVLPAQDAAAKLAAEAYREGARDLATAQQADRDLAVVRLEVAAARITAAERWIDVQIAEGVEPGAR